MASLNAYPKDMSQGPGGSTLEHDSWGQWAYGESGLKSTSNDSRELVFVYLGSLNIAISTLNFPKRQIAAPVTISGQGNVMEKTEAPSPHVP